MCIRDRFQEKPPVPKSNLASMGIYIFNWDVLKKYLEEDLSLIHISCAALEVQRSALAEALWAAVAAVLALSSTRATNCSYRVGGRSSEPPSVGRVA